MKYLAILLISFSSLFAALFPSPKPLRIIFGEQSLDLSWDSVPGATGYNIYTAPVPHLPLAKKRKINPALITSGPHFTYIWDIENGKRERKIKGRLHYLSITAVYEKKGRIVESKPSEETDDFYFKSFCNIDASNKIRPLLKKSQQAPLLPVASVQNSTEAFLRFMDGKGKALNNEIKSRIDPLQVGACAPISTLLVKLLKDDSLVAYRVEGNFINEYHTFVIINLEGVEYIVDFSADQFTPNVAPVFFPRDLSHLDVNGKLSETGRDIYLIGKIYSPEQSDLADNKTAVLYHDMYRKISGQSPSP